jgi:serine-type D-Ala-D-Ala carboxypeptidase/endopeptidase
LNKKIMTALAATVGTVIATLPVYAHVTSRLSADIMDEFGQQLFSAAQPVGMTMVVIDNGQPLFFNAGTTAPQNAIQPSKNSLIRIASLTKLFTNEVMVKLQMQGVLDYHDRLQKFAPVDKPLPSKMGHPIRLIDLATHTAGLPRELPGGIDPRPVFIWPKKQERWHWLTKAKLETVPGAIANYSNLGYDLLADGLQKAAGQRFPLLLKKLVLDPNHMSTTTYTPTSRECQRLMIPATHSSPCVSTLAAIGSGGLYSTPADMARWLQQFIPIYSAEMNKNPADTELAAKLLKMVYQRKQLLALDGMDVAGEADKIGLGWITLAAGENTPAIIEKTGGGGGFISYVALVPSEKVAVFVSLTRTSATRFSAMSDNVNALVAALIANHHSTSRQFS